MSTLKVWEAFDALPEPVREALRNASHDWPADAILSFKEQRGFGTAALLALIASLDGARRRYPQPEIALASARES